MCVCCRNRLSQQNLLRLQVQDNEIYEWRQSGRSFYLCKNCIGNDKFINKICKSLRLKNDNISNHLKEIVSKWQKNQK